MARLFLKLNHVAPSFDKGDATWTMIDLAAGDLTQDDLAVWFRANVMAA